MAVDVNIYSNNKDAAAKEVIRAKEVYTAKAAAGDTAGAKAASDWANKVRTAAGLSDADYGAKTTLANANTNYAATVKGALDATSGKTTNANNDPGIVAPKVTSHGFAASMATPTIKDNPLVAQYKFNMPMSKVILPDDENRGVSSDDTETPDDVGINATDTISKPEETSAEKFAREYQLLLDKFNASSTDPAKSMADFTANQAKIDAANAEAIRARVKAAIAEGTNAQNKIISEAPGQFVNPMNQASFQGAKNSQAIDERMAAMGLGRSGANITAQTSNANQTQADINDLEATKAKVISDAQQAIAQLQASGSLQEVQLVQEAAAASLQRLQDQQNIIENRSADRAGKLFEAGTSALKTGYDISSNDKQLGMQQQGIDIQNRQVGSEITGIDPLTGQKTAAQASVDWEQNYKEEAVKTQKEQWEKQFNSQEEQRIIENNLNLQRFDFEKETTAWTQRFQWKEFTWQKASTEIEQGFTKRQIDIDEKYKNKTISLQEKELAHKINIDNKSLALESAKFAFSKTRAASGGSKSKSGKAPTAAEKNASFADDYTTLKGQPVAAVKKELNDNAGSYIEYYGLTGYKSLWNAVLEDAFKTEGKDGSMQATKK
jgi:hypothetical protein